MSGGPPACQIWLRIKIELRAWALGGANIQFVMSSYLAYLAGIYMYGSAIPMGYHIAIAIARNYPYP